MLTTPSQPLEFARKVLSEETLKSVTRSRSYNYRGWKILDRWAYNSPAELKKLEQAGEIILLSRLLEQQDLEHRILLDQLDSGMAEHEILEMNQVETELVPTFDSTSF